MVYSGRSPQQSQKYSTGHCTGEDELLGSLYHAEPGYQEFRSLPAEETLVYTWRNHNFPDNRIRKGFAFSLPPGRWAASSTVKLLQQPHGRREVSFLAWT